MLKDFLPEIEAVLGVAQDAQSRAALLRRVNGAAKELYDTVEISYILKEQTFIVPPGDIHRITLPHYVGQIRAVRFSNLVPHNIEVTDLAPRYHETPWINPYNRWRLMGKNALSQTLVMDERLTFRTDLPNDIGIPITTKGRTTSSSNKTETVFIEPGKLDATTTSQWLADHEIGAVIKNVTIADVEVVGEASGTVYAIIPDRLQSVQHIVLDINPDVNLINHMNGYCIDVLFKPIFLPFVQDTDSFLDEKFEWAIVHKILEKFHQQSGDFQSASDARRNRREVVENLSTQHERQSDQFVRFTRQPNIYYR